MKQSHETQHIPKPWRNSRGIFIPKPGKADYNQPKSYRTITLSPVMLKLQEKVILWHMQNDLKIAQDTNKRQFGFKRGCSTEAALHKVTHMIERRIAKKGYVLGVFLDIEAAFDNVSFKAIANALSTTKLDPATAHWITNMVATRHITINHKDSTKTIRIKRGCPQGGILSPFLWNLVIDDLLNLSPKDTPGYLQAFADDIVSLAEGNDLDVIWDRTQKTLNTIMKWCTTKDLTISALKTKVVMFTWNKKWNLRPIVVDNTTIELSTSAKFLGITLDNKLNYNEHINNTTKKATASLMQCRKAVGPTWGLTPKTCIWIYKTIIRPIITYYRPLIHRMKEHERCHRLNNAYDETLDKVKSAPAHHSLTTGHRIAWNDITILKSLPSKAHLDLTEQAAIHIRNPSMNRTDSEAAKSNERLRAYGSLTRERPEHTKGTIKAHVTINNDFVKDHNSAYDETLDKNIINETPEDWITCYTDGSKTEEGCGAGYIITTNNNNTILHEDSLNLPNSCTVYQAELTAITYACRQLTNYTDKHIIIWTDSLSSINSLTTLITKNNTVKYCLDILNQIGAHNQVELRWIAAHSGLWGNEKADELAKHGTTSTTTIARPIPQAYINKLINDKVQKLNTDIVNKDCPRHTKLILGRNLAITQKLSITLIDHSLTTEKTTEPQPNSSLDIVDLTNTCIT
ncbi:hypothetical protein ACHWQZ_G009582 [Mnemiopsis leidyi]